VIAIGSVAYFPPAVKFRIQMVIEAFLRREKSEHDKFLLF